MRVGIDAATLDRFDEGLDIYAGLKTPPKQEPLLLNYPRLPAIPFYDRALFPWLETLEAATPVIQAELGALIESDFDRIPEHPRRIVVSSDKRRPARIRSRRSKVFARSIKKNVRQ